MLIRDRIKELRRVRARDLVPNPRNWRTHPAAQQDALRGVLAEVGYADALLARQLPNGQLELIDGHLRAETTPAALVPVLVLDVNEEEANKILLTHDPLSAMADADSGQLQELLADCSFDNPQVSEMLAGLDAQATEAEESLADQERAELTVPELFQVVIECAGADEQREMYDRMRKEGYKCRVLTL